MTDAAPRIWAFHAGPMVGYFVGREEVGAYVAPYILAAEHERLMAERDAEITRLRNDCRILLAQIAWLAECTGEGLEGEDAALVAEIAATVGDDNG